VANQDADLWWQFAALLILALGLLSLVFAKGVRLALALIASLFRARGALVLNVGALVIVAMVTAGAVKRTAGDMAASYRCHNDAKYQLSVENLHIAQSNLGMSDYKAAQQALQDGLFRLGNNYAREDVWDDTGLSVALASEHEFKGEHKLAAEAYEEVLKDRLVMYSDRWCRR